MGVCCTSAKADPAARYGVAPSATPRAKRPVRDLPAKAANRAVVAAAAAAAGAPVEEVRARARRRAVQALVESLRAGEAVIPSMKWRRQYLKTPGVGQAAVAAIANHLQGLPEVPAANGAAAGAATPPMRRPQHRIRTLDMRALHAGDDGFVDIMTVLLEDALVENAIFAGNEITDDGVRRIISRVRVFNGTPPPEGGPSAAALATTAAGNGSRRSLPCRLKLLALTDNLVTSDGIADFAAVAPLFRSLEQLEVGRGQSAGGGDIDDVRDTLSTDNVAAITAYIQRTRRLVTFLYKGNGNYYARNGFTPDALAAFVNGVVGRSPLKELYLQECYSTKPGMVGPVTVQAPRGANGSNGAAAAVNAGDELADSWRPERLVQPIQELATALNTSTSQLTTLALRFPLSEEAVQALAAGLAHAPRLLNLSVRGCELTSKSLSIIGGALVTNKTLVLLDVSYQASTIAHPAFLAELRSSSKRRMSFVSTMGYSAAEMARQDLSSGSSELPSREERQHPLLPIIRSLHKNRSIAQLVMLGVNITTDDIEELCACIERSGNRTLAQVWYTKAGNEALNMKLDDFLAANRECGAGTANGGGAFGYSSVCSSRAGGGGGGGGGGAVASVPVNGSSATFFNDTAALSDSSETLSRTNPDRRSTVRNTSLPPGPSAAPMQIPHHPPRNGSLTSTGGLLGDTHNGERRTPPSSLENTQTTLKLSGLVGKPNPEPPSSNGAAVTSPAQVGVTMLNSESEVSSVGKSRSLRLNAGERGALSGRSADMTDDGCTMPYYSHTAQRRQKKPQ